MKPNEPSRTALIIARQRAAHQVLDHGSILYDPFAMKILREDEEDVLQVLSHMRKSVEIVQPFGVCEFRLMPFACLLID